MLALHLKRMHNYCESTGEANMPTKVVQTTVTEKTHAELVRIAAADDRSLNTMVRKILTEYAAKHAKK